MLTYKTKGLAAAVATVLFFLLAPANAASASPSATCTEGVCIVLDGVPETVGAKGGGGSGSSGSSGSSGPKPHPLYGWYGWDWVYVDEHIGTIIPECVVGPLYTCPTARDIAAVQAASPQPLRPSFSDVSAIARQLVLTMSVDRPVIRVGPDPSANEWNMAVVGHPLWPVSYTHLDVYKRQVVQWGVLVWIAVWWWRAGHELPTGAFVRRGWARLRG